MYISNRAIEHVKKSNRAMGRLMVVFDRGQKSIENWMSSKDIRLTTPAALQIIREETGLLDSEILESAGMKAQQS